MKTYRLITQQIRQYVADEEIVPFLQSSSYLNDLYIRLKNQPGTNISVIVTLRNTLKHIFDLIVIVKHEKKSMYGNYEYFEVKNFVNRKTNLYLLFEIVSITSSATLTELVDAIQNQLTELGIEINQEFVLHSIKGRKPRMYFEKVIRTVGLN